MNTKDFVLVLFFLFFIGCGQNEDSERTERKDRSLMTAIESTDWSVQSRAIQELQGTLDHKPLSRKALIQCLFSSDVDTGLALSRLLEIAKVLAQAEQPPVSELINAFRSGNSSYENLEKLLVVLGQMGPKAKSAIAFLLEQLDQQKEDPEREGAIRAVLLNIGYQSEENLSTLLSDIRGHTESGNAAISMMGKGSIGPSTDDEIIFELVKLLVLDEPTEESVFAAVALGLLGERGRPGIMKLHRLLGYAEIDQDYGSLRIVYGLSLAKVDPGESGEALRSVLKYMGSERFGNHTDFDAIGLTLALIEPGIIKQVAEGLDHRDPEVIGGALWMLWAVGLDAREYTPKVLEILRKDPWEDLRKLAARALGYMADPHDIPTLEAVLKKEQSEFVREEITDTIRIIRLEVQE